MGRFFSCIIDIDIFLAENGVTHQKPPSDICWGGSTTLLVLPGTTAPNTRFSSLFGMPALNWLFLVAVLALTVLRDQRFAQSRDPSGGREGGGLRPGATAAAFEGPLPWSCALMDI